eukprot:2402076-Amphidinium_carterae.1
MMDLPAIVLTFTMLRSKSVGHRDGTVICTTCSTSLFMTLSPPEHHACALHERSCIGLFVRAYSMCSSASIVHGGA